MVELKNKALFKTQSLINGKWVKGKNDATFPVVNPFDEQEIAQVSDMGAQEAHAAVEAAHQAFKGWSALTPKERGSYLLKWEELLRKNWDDLSALLTCEEGKPQVQSTHELMGCSGFLTWYAEEAKRLYGHILTSPDPHRRFLTIQQPLGVVAVITPWNFPSVLPIQKCAPALAAGCTVVLKPSEETPLSALAHAYLAQEAGIPKGVFNVIACRDPKDVGQALLSHPSVKKLSFTGSTAVGKKLSSLGAHTVKNLCLELGGNCPVIVFEDADLTRAVEETFWPKFYNSGQCCNNINRFFVHKTLYLDFIEKFHQMIKKHLKLGDGNDPKTVLGPLINQAGLLKVDQLVQEALSKGATSVAGGKCSLADGPLFYAPTLLSNVTPNMRLYREEIFGPVAPIYPFSTEEEVIAMANDTTYGLAAYLFTTDHRRIWRVSEALEAGSIGVNTCDVCSELLPFGGWKESGIGRENGAVSSLNSYCELKSIVLGGM